MRVSLIKNYKIKTILLPRNVQGSFWIVDNDINGIQKNLISIEADNGKWKLISNKEVTYIENGISKDYVYLDTNNFYNLENNIEKTTLLLYSSPDEIRYEYYDMTQVLNKKVQIGNSNSCEINYSILGKEEAYITKENDKVYIYDNNSKFGVYVNEYRVFNKRMLVPGDVIFIFGLKMIYYVHFNNDGTLTYCLLINNTDNNKINVKLLPITISIPNESTYTETSEEIQFPLYKENDYFHRMPRFVPVVKALEISVDSPPGKQNQTSTNLILTLGPMLTMSMTSMVTGYTAINNVLSGNSSWSNAMPSLVMTGAMLASSFIWPLFSRRYAKKLQNKAEKLRQKKYKEYIDSKRMQIIEAKKEQCAALNNNFPSAKQCEEIILNKYVTLWQKKIEDEDYLQVNLGIGSFPMKIDIKYPEEKFTLVEDNLASLVGELGKEPKVLPDVPVSFSFIENNKCGIIGQPINVHNYMKKIVLQLLTFHSYDNLKIVVFTDQDNEDNWNFLKNAPHVFSDDRTIRFFSSNSDEYKEVAYYLERVYNTRKDSLKDNKLEVQSLDKLYLIITDSFKNIRDYTVINNILENKTNMGFSICVLDKQLTSLPDQCEDIIELENDNGRLRDTKDFKEVINFKVEPDNDIDYNECVKKLANIPINIDSDEEGQLPNKIGFLEMYDVGKIEQLNSLNRWQKSNPMMNLQVPVGVGKNGETISIDLHEKYHGPHGLIAGMTGSGKSEFIITYILSMAVNFHPYEVQFVLIDYKGGGLAGAFKNDALNLKLPHLVGTITNLDTTEINRGLASIESELKRRQALFNQARELSGESTIDIYKYQKMYRNGVVKEPVSHLFIICDEFAELKVEQPDFMQQLISTARIGRSLGVHLILATQKPSGVVDPQIWSNSRFRVCMRVQEKSDSNEVIKSPDAAYLKQTGRFYFQVGFNEIYVLGQAAWAGGKYYPTEKVQKTLDTSIDYINNIGYIYKESETVLKQEKKVSSGEELLNILKYLDRLAKEEKIYCKPLWLERISNFITPELLIKKYQYTKENFIINPVIGEYDLPHMQKQNLLTLPITKEGNAIIYGSTGSGKENFVTTAIYDTMIYHTATEVNYYIIDFGSGALKMFRTCPIVGDVIDVSDAEKLDNLYKMISSLIEERKNLFYEYSGDYLTYVKRSGKFVPNVIVVINNFELYQETYPSYDDSLAVLSRECTKYGIYFILTVNTPNGVRFKVKQNFSLTYVLNQNNEDDYSTILGNVRKMYPSKVFGRGIIKMDNIYEFQTAQVVQKDDINKFISERCQLLKSKASSFAKKIPVLPSQVIYSQLDISNVKTEELVVGVDKETLDVSVINLNRNYVTLSLANDITEMTVFINSYINQINVRKNYDLLVIDCASIEIDSQIENIFNKDFDIAFNKIMVTIENNTNTNMLNVVITGLDVFKSKLNADNQSNFNKIFEKAKDTGKISYTIFDTVGSIKKFEYESWFKSVVDTTSGIWFGSGINDQYSLKISKRIDEMKEDVPVDFCFLIKKGKCYFVKYISRI